MGDEQRDRQRVPLAGEVQGEVTVFQPMTILDISLGGAMIETTFPLQVDSLHDFRLGLSGRSVVFKGRVAYCHVGELTQHVARYRVGVEFIELSEHVRAAVTDFVRAVQEMRQNPPVIAGVIAGDDESG